VKCATCGIDGTPGIRLVRLLAMASVLALAACGSAVPPGASQVHSTASMPASGSAPSPAGPNLITFPASGGTVQLTCTGTLALTDIEGTTRETNYIPNALAHVFINNQPVGGTGITGPSIEMGGPDNAELLASVEANPSDGERVQAQIDAVRWDIRNSHDHSSDRDTHISIDGQTGHLNSDVVSQDYEHSYTAVCKPDTPDQISARQAQQELQNNPHLVSVLRLKFLPTAACDAYRQQLLAVAHQPLDEVEWTRYLENTTSAADSAGCFLP
jgi:hypothetical protein